jgi:hypothetical protein
MLQNSEKYKQSRLGSPNPKINQKVPKTKEKHQKPLSFRCFGGEISAQIDREMAAHTTGTTVLSVCAQC